VANIKDFAVKQWLHQPPAIDDTTTDASFLLPEAGGPAAASEDKNQLEIQPYDYRWQPQLLHEGNPAAPFGGLWMVRVPTPTVETRTKDDGSTYQQIRTRYAVSYGETEAIAQAFAVATWRDAYAKGLKPIRPDDPDPTMQRVLRWSGLKTPESEAWLHEQMETVRAHRIPNTAIFLQYVDPQVAVKFRFPKPPSVEDSQPPAMEDDRRYGEDDIEDGSQLQLSQEENATLYLQRHAQRDGYFLWQGIESRSRQPDSLFNRAAPIAVIPALFDSARQAAAYAKDLGFATVTAVGEATMLVKNPSDPDHPQTAPANLDVLRQARVKKDHWSPETRALDLFNRLSQSPAVKKASWRLPYHGWQTAPVARGLETTWVVWRQRAGVGWTYSDVVRDSVDPQRPRHYASLDAVRRDYPEVARHPHASPKIGRLVAMNNLGPRIPDNATAPPLNPMKMLLKPIQSPQGTEWLETVIATDIQQNITWAASHIGQDIRPWNVARENPYDGHARLVDQYVTTGTIQDPTPSAPSRPTATAPTPSDPAAGEHPPAPGPSWRDTIEQPVARIAAIDDHHWGVYAVTQHGFREEHAWITRPPAVDRVVRPNPQLPESVKAPALAHVGNDLWIAVPKDYTPQAALTTWPSAEAATTAAAHHDFVPETDPRPMAEVQRELRRAPFVMQDLAPSQTATAYVTELSPGRYAAWVDTGAPNFRAWVMQAPDSPQPTPALHLFTGHARSSGTPRSGSGPLLPEPDVAFGGSLGPSQTRAELIIGGDDC